MATVLLADHDDETADFIGLFFEAEGYRFLRQVTGAGVLNALAEANLDVVIIDSALPDMDGLTLLDAIKSNPMTAHVDVIVLSGKRSIDHIEQVFALGASDFVTKPFMPAELVVRCQHLSLADAA